MSSISLETVKTDTFKPWIVCLSAALFFFYEFIQMNIFNAISGALLQEFKLNATDLGHLSAAYFYATVLFLFPAATILDRVSTRKVILTALTICVLGTFGFALSHSLPLIFICRFLTGIGSAFCFLSCVKLASRWFPPYRMALIIGLIVTLAMLGGLVAQTPLTLLSLYVGWRNTLLIDAAFGVIIILVIIFNVQNYPSHHIEVHKSEKRELQEIGYWRSFGLVLKKPHNWLCGIYACLLNLPIYLLGGIWGIQYLQHLHGISNTQASFVTSMLFIGTVFGSPLVGWISDQLRRRRILMIIGAVLSLTTILIIMLFDHLSLSALMFMFFVLGLVTATQIISYPFVAENNPKLLTATSVSVVSISVLSGGAIFEPFFGWLMDSHWQGAMLEGTRVYAAADYQFAMWLFPIAFVLGLIATLFLREKH